MQIHYLKHVPFEGLGSMESHLQQAGHQISLTNLYLGDQLPPADDIDMLIVMGGPMGVDDAQQYPWLTPEKRFIAETINLDKPVLGICLGAQLVAQVLGAKVTRNIHKEIGWFDVTLEPDFLATSIGKLLPNPLNALQWHGDTFELPSGAIALGSTQACTNQGFLYKTNVLGLQFHLEMTVNTVSRLISHCGHELDNSGYVHSAEQLLESNRPFEQSNKLMNDIVDIFINNKQLQYKLNLNYQLK